MNVVIGILAASVLASSSEPHLSIPEVIHAKGAELALANAVDLRSMPPGLRDAIADLIVIRSEQPASMVFERQDFTARLRRLAPALTPLLDAEATGTITVEFDLRPSPPEASAAPCARVLRRVAKDTFLLRGDLEPWPCEGSRTAASAYYDRAAGFSRAKTGLEPGDVIAAPASSTMADVPPGQAVVLAVKVGPVTVERTAQAVQPARRTDRLFVAGEAGDLFQAPALEPLQ